MANMHFDDRRDAPAFRLSHCMACRLEPFPLHACLTDWAGDEAWHPGTALTICGAMGKAYSIGLCIVLEWRWWTGMG